MNNRLYKLMNWPEIEEIIYSDGNNPHKILGPHKTGNNILIQTFHPNLKNAYVVTGDGKETKMELADEEGFYAALVPYKANLKYNFKFEDNDGNILEKKDPYAFDELITSDECKHICRGVCTDAYEKLGSHIITVEKTEGTVFRVWAPSCARVSVVGDFNGHDGRVHQMRKISEDGIYELFIPENLDGCEYQYEIKTKSGEIYLRPDPYAFKAKDYKAEVSVVSSIEDIAWSDSAWIAGRKKYDKYRSALSICEISIDGFAKTCDEDGEECTYENLAGKIIKFVKSNGFNAIELLPIFEHDNVHKFDVNSFYAIKGEYGTASDFMKFVDMMHKEGIRVIADWTGTYFPIRDYGMSMFDGHALYEYPDKAKALQPGTNRYIFDYGRREVINFLLSNAAFILNKFHIDGLRLTDVSKILYLDYDRGPGQWTPNIYGSYENLEAEDFLRELTTFVNDNAKGVLMITKETACWPHLTDSVQEGGLGFDFKWNNGWSHDFLNYLENDPIFRGQHHNELTFSMMYSYTEKFILAFSHEDVGGYPQLRDTMPGDKNAKEANVRMALAYMMTHPGRKMLYHGMNEVSMEQGLQLENFVYHLNMMYFDHPALYELDDVADGFEWINSMAANLCMLAFVRKSKKDEEELLVVMNMAGVGRELTVGVNHDGRYEEILNTDDVMFGGSGIVNDRKIEALLEEADGREYSIKLNIAPLSLCVFSFIPYTEKEKKIRRIKKDAQEKKIAEQAKNRETLMKKHEEEEAKLLKQLKEKYEKELMQQQKAIEEKYEKIEEEKIFAIVSDATLKEFDAIDEKSKIIKISDKKDDSTKKKATSKTKTSKTSKSSNKKKDK